MYVKSSLENGLTDWADFLFFALCSFVWMKTIGKWNRKSGKFRWYKKIKKNSKQNEKNIYRFTSETE